MKLTIIPFDKAVYKNGKAYDALVLSSIPEEVHALQWQDTQGWIEYKDGRPNETISELPLWADDAHDEWNTKQAEADALIAESENPSSQSYAQKLAWIIDERNKRLASCDWTQLADVAALHDDVWVNNWKVYRQALRDLPDSVDVNSPTYPLPPL
jgi:hypothetical protein